MLFVRSNEDIGNCTNKGDCLYVCYLCNPHPCSLENSLHGGQYFGLV